MGSFSLNELQNTKNRCGLGIERDLLWHPRKASELWDALNNGEHL